MSFPSETKSPPTTRKAMKGGTVEKGQHRTKVTVKTEKDPEDGKNPGVPVRPIIFSQCIL